jgi:hypothetical protein
LEKKTMDMDHCGGRTHCFPELLVIPFFEGQESFLNQTFDKRDPKSSNIVLIEVEDEARVRKDGP